jgi:shikimate kinase
MAFAATSRHSGKKDRRARKYRQKTHRNPRGYDRQGPENTGMQRLKKTVVMVGMMGAGKTAVGMSLARVLDVEFLDSDEEIVRAADRSIAEIFERDGEPFFRARETEVLGRLLRGTPCVLSTGGGAFLAETNRKLIHDAGISVWLRADLDLLWQRVRHKTTRPLLRTANPRDTLAALYQARVPLYELADLVVDSVADLSVDIMAQRVAAALLQRPDVLERT